MYLINIYTKAIEYSIKNIPAAKEALLDMPPR